MKKRTAFTLVELLVVMAIIGILAGILFPALGGIRKKARRTQSHTLVTQVQDAWIIHFNEFRSFPSPDLFEDKETEEKDVKFPMTPQNLALLNWRTKKPLNYRGKAANWDKDVVDAATKAIKKGSPNKPRNLAVKAEDKNGDDVTYEVLTQDKFFEIDNVQWVVGVVNTWGARAAQKGFNDGLADGAKSEYRKYCADHPDPRVWACIDTGYDGSVSYSDVAIHKVSIAWVNSENANDKVIESW